MKILKLFLQAFPNLILNFPHFTERKLKNKVKKKKQGNGNDKRYLPSNYDIEAFFPTFFPYLSEKCFFF